MLEWVNKTAVRSSDGYELHRVNRWYYEYRCDGVYSTDLGGWVSARVVYDGMQPIEERSIFMASCPGR
jgi:hypothetical protein